MRPIGVSVRRRCAARTPNFVVMRTADADTRTAHAVRSRLVPSVEFQGKWRLGRLEIRKKIRCAPNHGGHAAGAVRRQIAVGSRSVGVAIYVYISSTSKYIHAFVAPREAGARARGRKTRSVSGGLEPRSGLRPTVG